MKQYKLVHGHLTINKQTTVTAPAIVTLSDEDAALMKKSGVIQDIEPEAPAEAADEKPVLTDDELAALELEKSKQDPAK